MKITAAFILLLSPAASIAFGFSDVHYWVGTGSNRAALVIDWVTGPGPRSVAIGYRFDGQKTGRDMLDAMSKMQRSITYVLVPGVPYTAVFGIGYDRNGGGLDPVDPGDSYAEGWFTSGFWGYYEGTTTSETLGGWKFADSGFQDRLLVDGSWDGWAWAPEFSGSSPATPVAVPEPAPLAMVVTGLVFLTKRKFLRD